MWNNWEKVDINRLIELQTFKNINRTMREHPKFSELLFVMNLLNSFNRLKKYICLKPVNLLKLIVKFMNLRDKK